MKESPTSEVELKAIALFEDGYDIYNVALHTHLKRAKVTKIISIYLLKNGKPIEDIAIKLETSTSTVYSIAKSCLTHYEFEQQKIQTKIYRDSLTPKMLELLDAGSNLKSISYKLKMPVNIVKRKLILSLLKSGRTIDDVSLELGVKLNNIYPVAKKVLSDEEFKQIRKKEKESRAVSKEEDLTEMANLIITMSKCGISVVQISDACKVSAASVKKVLGNPIYTRYRVTSSKFETTQIVLEQLNSGKALKEVGDMLGLSPERVRQIAKKYHYSLKEQKLKRKKCIIATQVLLEQRIKSWVVQHPSCYVNEIASEFNLTEEKAWKFCPNLLRTLVILNRQRDGARYVKYPREETLEALRKAYELRNPLMSMYSVNETRPLTGPFYEKLRKENAIQGPSHARILQVFGTWKEACEEAGVTSVIAPRDSYELRWTNDELINQLGEFILTSESKSVASFDAWCRLDNSRASSGTLRNQIGTWFASYELALLQLRKRWTTD